MINGAVTSEFFHALKITNFFKTLDNLLLVVPLGYPLSIEKITLHIRVTSEEMLKL